ncbi:DUF1801 domain-containing protein [Urbifossiella limnaea]|uniref:YdhG-like domain-containing protein n=1 Tax=Urbifossiella limnaea TaxID=2528023 RepID=A0A517XWZ2_9BACT|nr:DUF1801 domain-containing protein [Urbifossiella limnaea]QDU22031.1 hypothetical protein ETAA1_40060 [Urbifossiella limnaea]
MVLAFAPDIVGFGRYHYEYQSGHSGDTCVVGLSPRKASLSLYVTNDVTEVADLLGQLGEHTTGKACAYVKSLDRIDLAVLRKLVKRAVARAERK